MAMDPREREELVAETIAARGDHFEQLETLEMLAPAVQDTADNEVALKSLSQWQLARRRFLRHRLALIGLFVFMGMVFVASFGPILVPFRPAHLPRRHQARRRHALAGPHLRDRP